MIANAVFTIADALLVAGALAWVAKRRDAPAFLRSFVWAGVPSMIGAAALSADGFQFFRHVAVFLFVLLPLYLAGSAALLFRRDRRLAAAVAVGALGLVAVGVDAFLVEPERLEVTRHRMTTSKLRTPLRIAVLSDLQTDAPGEYERRAIRLALAERPDVILLPGDFIQIGDPEAYARAAADLRQIFVSEGLRAPLGVYAVGGNTDGPGWRTVFEGLPVRAFTETVRHRQGPIGVLALSMEDSRTGDVRDDSPSDLFEIVLGHYPDFALSGVRGDLLVAGHTHGGQVQLPGWGPLLTFSRVPRAWAAGGLFPIPGNRTLVVSRGIGMERAEAPRLRFLCRPEVVIIDVEPEE